ncbi:MAG: hypothetical protein WD934_06555 [Gemmatimonadales bacterium]
MQPVARALGALFVIGLLFAPYAQPVFCAARMGPDMDMPTDHAGHGTDTDAPRVDVTSTATSCVPLCLTAQLAPMPRTTPAMTTGAQSTLAEREPAAAHSTHTHTTPPPPKA